MILPIVLYGSSVLREIAKPIDKDYPNIKELIDNMFETMKNAVGVGLAAPQVGLSIRLFVIDISSLIEDVDDFTELKGLPKQKVFINAQIVEKSGEVVSQEEGCLSLPNISELVPRYDKIRIQYQDENFEEHDEVFEGYFARIIQHEYDHTEGKVFTDNISPLRKQLVKSKLVNLTKRKVNCSYKFR